MAAPTAWQRALRAMVIVVLSGLGGVSAAPAPTPPDGLLPPATPLGTRQVWRTALTLRSVDTIKAYYLVNGVIYATASDGQMHAVDARSGRILWAKALDASPGVMYCPFVYYSPDFYGVGITLSDQLVILNPDTGAEYRRLRFESGAAAAATASGDTVFTAEVNRFSRAYEIKDSYRRWQIMTEGPLAVAPMFLNDLQTVFLADMSGTIAMVWANDKEPVYMRRLSGGVTGWLTRENLSIYAATDDNALYRIDPVRGETLWEYRLPSKPTGGPVVLNGSVYQALAGGGIQRVGIERDRPNWLDPDATQFLAEWGEGRAVLLHKDGRIVVADPQTGAPSAYVNAPKASQGMANTANDALILTTAAGEIRCLQPINASPASLAKFRAPTTQPTTQPSEPPLLVRTDTKAEETILFSHSSGQGGGSRAGRDSGGGRGERSAGRSSRGGGRSGRGEGRGARGGRGGGRSSRGEGRSGGRGGRSSRGGGRSSRGGGY